MASIKFTLCVLSSSCLIYWTSLSAQSSSLGSSNFGSTNLGSSSSSGSGGMQTLKPLETTKKTPPPAIVLPPIKPPELVNKVASYFHPGILVWRDNGWVGGDHMLNLTNNIGVYVTVIKAEKETFQVDEAALRQMIESLFKEANISPKIYGPVDQPPLPFFQVEIMIYPVEQGYVASCTGRLFEAVSLARFLPDPKMTFQAITWEKDNLIVAPTDKINTLIHQTIADIVKVFTERYTYFSLRKREELRN